jgi:hypothetical protein
MTRSEEECALAAGYGFTPEPDGRRGPGWCSFRRGDVVVWQCMHKMRPHWARARLDDNRYVEHTYHLELAEALAYEPTREG